jgi:hypothetical protein
MHTKEHKAIKRSYSLRWCRMMVAIPDVPLPDNELRAFQHFTDNLLLRELGLPHDLKLDEAEIADTGVAALADVMSKKN